LLNGLDDIAQTLSKSAKIKALEAQRLASFPWLVGNPGQ
jgi:3-isopropylmalate/(R)-2-methylmalate dehydratase small subunit